MNKVCREYIGLIVMGCFNASIRRDAIREEFRYEEDEGAGLLASSSWRSRDASISAGTDVVFVIDGCVPRRAPLPRGGPVDQPRGSIISANAQGGPATCTPPVRPANLISSNSRGG